MIWKCIPTFGDGPLWGKITKEGKSQTIPWLFQSLYSGCSHLGSKSGRVLADKGVSAVTVLEGVGKSMTQKSELRCMHYRGMS